MPPRPTRVRAALACRLVDLDRVQFNDAVASGAYPCAPATAKGAARVFSEAELLPLYFFARLTDFGVPVSLAGKLACEVGWKAAADYSEPADRITFVKGTLSSFFTPSKVREADGGVRVGYDPEHEAVEHLAGAYGVGRVVFTVDFYINHVREIIARGIAAERGILGSDDE